MSIPKISELSDRELMEHIFATQVVLMQSVYRVDDFLKAKYGSEFGDKVIHKDATIERLTDEVRDVWTQYHGLLRRKD